MCQFCQGTCVLLVTVYGRVCPLQLYEKYETGNMNYGNMKLMLLML